jgi:hypothetical protein
MVFLTRLNVLGLSFSRYFRKKNKQIILNALLNELFASYSEDIIKTLNEQRLINIVRHIGKCFKRHNSGWQKQKIIRKHLELSSSAENRRCPYVMFILNIVHIAFLYNSTKQKKNLNEFSSLKTSVDNLIEIYSRRVSPSITRDVLGNIANIIINCNLIYYRHESSSLFDDLNTLIELPAVQNLPVLHIMLHAIKITLHHL